ncbi:MAG: carbohydrate-binding protein [Opitutales bacterium]
MNSARALLLCVVSIFAQFNALAWNSSRVFHGGDGRLTYVADENSNRIVDFSHAGYRGGGVDFPNAPVVKTIDPIEGDNTEHIQNAIDEVAAMPVGANGYRGTLLLNAGNYDVENIVYIRESGIILRGRGPGSGPNATRITGTSTKQRKERGIIVIEPLSSRNQEEAGTRQNIVSSYIPAGCRTFEVEDASIYSVGDYLIIEHLATDAWLNAVNYGNIDGDPNQWKPGDKSLDMFFHGNVTAIVGNQIKLDSPIYHEIDRNLAQATVYRHSGQGIVQEVGVKDLRVVSQNQGGDDESHPWDCVHFIHARNCWVQNVTAKGFAESGIRFSRSERCTALDCRAIDPVSKISGGRRYNFFVGTDSHDILIKGCEASNGRHCFVANGGAGVNGIVFTQSTANRSYSASENHRRWGSAMLWDDITWTNPKTSVLLALYNRGDSGTAHGWTGTGQVAWNVSVPGGYYVICEEPPLGQNYAIATDGNVGRYVYDFGHVEGTGKTPNIQSLYEAQLADRLTYGVGPDQPVRLKATHYRNDESPFVALDWLDTALDEDSFVIERTNNGTENYRFLTSVPANVTGYTDTSVEVDGVYKYRVRAKNTFNRSAFSNPVTVNLGVSEKRFLWTYQAEYYTRRSGAPVQWNNHRWTGMGYSFLNSEGSWIEYDNIEGGKGGIAQITIFFSTPRNRTGDLLINGETVASFDFQDTGGWSDWEYVRITTPLETGMNTLRIVNTSGGEGIRIDRIEIRSTPAIYAAGDYAPDGAASNAFDADENTQWIHFSPLESWIDNTYDDPLAVGYYSVRSGSGPQENDPMDWKLQANNGGGTWTTLDTRQGVVFDTRGELKTFSVQDPGEFKRYRLFIEKVNDSDAAHYVQIAELEYNPVAWPLEGYYAWSNTNGLKGFMEADDDGDARSNLYEYAFNGDPLNSSDLGEMPSVSFADDLVSYTYPKRSDDPLLKSTLEISTDLISWQPTSTDITLNPSGDYEEITESFNHSGDSLFIRLIVSHD